MLWCVLYIYQPPHFTKLTLSPLPHLSLSLSLPLLPLSLSLTSLFSPSLFLLFPLSLSLPLTLSPSSLPLPPREPTPPTTRHHRLNFPIFGLHSDTPPSPSPSSSSDDNEDAFIRHLRSFTRAHPRPHPHRRSSERRGAGQGAGSALEHQLQQVMELSRQEHEERVQLEAGQWMCLCLFCNCSHSIFSQPIFPVYSL